MTRIPIRAAVLRQPGNPLAIEELQLDEPMAGEVRIRTHAVGLCHSDLHYILGTLPIEPPVVVGHEASGQVEAVGEGVRSLTVGDRVVATITPNCGHCAQCAAGRATLCQILAKQPRRTRPIVTDSQGNAVNSLGSIGAFAEGFIVPERAAIFLDAAMTDAEACLLGCCVATGFGAVIHGARVGPRDTVAVIGCGGVGIAAIQAARIAGARKIVAVDLHKEKLDRALCFGATHQVISGDSATVQTQMKNICPGGVTKSFEAVGSPATAALAFDMLAPDGTATILGLQPAERSIEINAERLIEGDRKVTGAYMGANQLPSDLPALIDHHSSGNLLLNEMITSRWAFESINQGFDALQEPQSVRAVVEF